MMKQAAFLFLMVLSACRSEGVNQPERDGSPQASNNGEMIVFPEPGSDSFFKTEQVNSGDIRAELTAPANVAATVLASDRLASHQIVLFENSELTGNYTNLIRHQTNIDQIRNINIRQLQLELARTKDLHLHGAATGQDLLNAETALSVLETNLANEITGLMEQEASILSAGFDPDGLQRAKSGTAYLICDIPENQLERVKKGSRSTIRFTAIPDEEYTGIIESVADRIDPATRMVKLRLRVDNRADRLKAGMFAIAAFGITEENSLAVNKNALVTVQGRNYVFVKTGRDTFERREIQAGPQIGDRMIVFSGLDNEDDVVVEGVMQLKGLSFGY